eukprot:1147780-Pelagomonas_calceolata.AAC.4
MTWFECSNFVNLQKGGLQNKNPPRWDGARFESGLGLPCRRGASVLAVRRTLLRRREARWRSATRPRKCARQASSKREVLEALERSAPHPGILVLLTFMREDF